MMSKNYFTIELPSKGQLYSGVDPQDIKVRPFTGADEAILSEMSEKNAVEKITEVLGRTLQGIDIKELTLGDKMSLMVWHAINSYADGFSANIVCEHCLQTVDVDYKLAEGDVSYLKDSYKEPYNVSLSDGSVVGCRLLRVKDELAINNFEKTLNNAYLHKIAIYIVDDKNIAERVEWLSSLPSKDIAKIRAFQETYYHGPSFTFKYVCPKCGGEGKFQAPFRFASFFPYGDALTKNFGPKV